MFKTITKVVDLKYFKYLELVMGGKMVDKKTYSINEVARLSGLPESTLRYYESIGIIQSIKRDISSGHRIYHELDLDQITSISCLSATGMSISDMKIYLENAKNGGDIATEQIRLLSNQQARLKDEAKLLALRDEYLKIKIGYWEATLKADDKKLQEARRKASELAKELKGK